MIYIVEDDDNIRKLIGYALTKEGYDTAGFSCAHEFWSGISKELPELIMLDIMLPEEDGLSILKRLRSDEMTKNIPIIMVSAKGSEFDKVCGLDLGADDYIAKPFGMTELTARVRAVMRRAGGEKSGSGKYTAGPLYLNEKKHIASVFGKELDLSYKEFMLLLELMKGGGDVVSRDKLLNAVWGEFYDESRTLDVHIRKLRIKLGDAGKMIKTVKNVGYKIGGDTNDR